MVFQIRGTSGSGKSWVVRQLFNRYSFSEVKSKGIIMGYYCKELNLFIVGKYTTSCGGTDTIKTQDEICSRVEKACEKGWHVLFEGLIASHIAQRYADMYFRHEGEAYFIFLDTPFDSCVENILKRRAEAGTLNSKSPAKNTRKDYDSTHSSMTNMIKMGVPKKYIKLTSSEKALGLILKKLKSEE